MGVHSLGYDNTKQIFNRLIGEFQWIQWVEVALKGT